MANMIELLKSFVMYHSPMSEAWKAPIRPVEVPCDVTPNLAAYQTAAETRTHSFGMHTELTAARHAYTSFCMILVRSVEIVPKLTALHRTCAVQRHLCVVFWKVSPSPISLTF